MDIEGLRNIAVRVRVICRYGKKNVILEKKKYTVGFESFCAS